MVIQKFGGIRPLARAMGEWPNNVQRWKDNGFIPSDRHLKVMEIAKEKGIEITPDQLIGATK